MSFPHNGGVPRPVSGDWSPVVQVYRSRDGADVEAEGKNNPSLLLWPSY